MNHKQILERAVDEPLASWDELLPVHTARLVWANFRHLRSIIGKGDGVDPAISAWLSSNGGLVSIAQASYHGMSYCGNSPTISALRPPRYGRAAIFIGQPCRVLGVVFPQLVLDIKGCGVGKTAIPAQRIHETGILPLHAAIQEVINNGVLSNLTKKFGLPFRVLPPLGIVHLGYRVEIPEMKQPVIAATLLRPGHRRPKGNEELAAMDSPEMHVQHEIEASLRRFGITSTSSHYIFELKPDDTGASACYYARKRLAHVSSHHLAEFTRKFSVPFPSRFAVTNNQIARLETNDLPMLIDLGHYKSMPEFVDPFITFVRDRPLNWGRVTAPTAVGWTQPEGSKTLANGLLRASNPPPEVVQHFGLRERAIPGARLKGLELEMRLHLGKAGEDQVAAEIDDFIERVIRSN